MRLKKIISVLLVAVLVICLSGCGKSNEIRVAVIVKSLDSDFWKNFKSGVDSAATEYNVNVTFEGPENEEDYSVQNKMITNAVEKGADVIVFSAIDRTRNAPAVNAAVRKGVKVITADSALDSSLVSLFIGTDNPKAGEEAAKALAAQFTGDDDIKLGIVGCGKKTENIIEREDGLREYLGGLQNAEIISSVTAESNIESAKREALDILKSHPEINALVGLNEWSTLGVCEAVKSLGASGKIKTVGFDTNTIAIGMLETGEMGALIVQNPFAMGYLSVKKAAEMQSGKIKGNDVIYTSVTTVTKQNMYQSDIQKILFDFKDGE